MKRALVLLGAVGALSCTGAAYAADGADVAKAKGCLNCHAVDGKKVGPSFKDIAAKRKAGDEADVIAKLKSGKGHPKTSASDEDLKTIYAWILTRK